MKIGNFGLRILQDFSCTRKISKPLHNGDWKYFFVIRIIDLLEFDVEIENNQRYLAEIHAVSLEAASENNFDNIMRLLIDYVNDDQKEQFDECKSYEDLLKINWNKYNQISNDQHLHCLLCECGISACLWSKTFSNKRLAATTANQELLKIEMMFGFYMDMPLNLLGNTGWDFIAGNIGLHSSTIVTPDE